MLIFVSADFFRDAKSFVFSAPGVTRTRDLLIRREKDSVRLIRD